jgi:hypothetical protein
MNEEARLRWRCRRGMRELDVLLQRYLDDAGSRLDAAGREMFSRFLDESDPDILDWIGGRKSPNNAAYGAIIEQMRNLPPSPSTTAPDGWFCELPQFAALDVRGADAGEFLHGQFTGDVLALAPGRVSFSAWCTAQGRVVATFVLARGTDGYCIVLPAELAAAFSKRLRMFVLRSRVSIEPARPEQALLGIGRQWTAQSLADPWTVVERDGLRIIALPGPRTARYLVSGDAAGLHALRATMPAGFTTAGAASWTMQDIESGLPWSAMAGGERFLPQELDLEAVGALSFSKGCYPGQEIVARVHYRGRAKRALYRVRGPGPAPADGVEIVAATGSGQPAGQLLNCVGGADRWCALAVLNVESATSGGLRLAGRPDDGFDVTPAH